MTYKDNLVKAMAMLGEHKDTIFLGQSVRYKGTGLFWTLEKVPMDKRIELPIFEDIQMGMSIGMSLEGYIPVSVYPRWDFLLLALNQLVNHADKMKVMSDGQFEPHIIIRTSVGSVKPLFPGPQHIGDYTDAVRLMCKEVQVIKLEKAEDVIPTYLNALLNKGVYVIVEVPDLYGTN